MEELLTIKEVSEILNAPVATVRGWCNKGKLATHSLTNGGHRRFLKSDIQSILDEGAPICNYGFLTEGMIKGEVKKIDGYINEYVSTTGDFYMLTLNGRFYKRSTYDNHGYAYIGLLNDKGDIATVRAHREVAKTFIENPNNYDIVGHKNNIKNDNRVENLYWTTVSKNTQKAHDDKLVVNDIGIEDSQSIPVACYKNDGALIGVYGSIREAGRCIDGFSASSIHKVVDSNGEWGIKGYYFKSISKEFYYTHKDIQGIKFSVNKIKKTRHVFEVYDKDGILLDISNNQNSVAKKYQISQPAISQVMKKGEGYVGDYYFKKVN